MHTLGCDGCRAGWLIIQRTTKSDGAGNPLPTQWTWRVAATFAPSTPCASGETTGSLPDFAFIDMPIGLAEREARACDQAARKYLGKGFGSSVYPTPVRATLAATSYPEANALNRANSGKGLSKQAYFLLPKIREIDIFLSTHNPWQGRLREAHPEVAFAAINGRPLEYKKKTTQGFDERLRLLTLLDVDAGTLVEEILSATARKDVAKDDVLDALCLTLMPLNGELRTLPQIPEQDSRGLPMEICYFE